MYYGILERVLPMDKFKFAPVLIGLAVVYSACSQNFSDEEPAVAMANNGFKPVVDEVALDIDGSGGEQAFGPLRGEAQQGWIVQKPSSSMRVAQYGLPGPAGEATLGVFYFGPGQGGGIEANIDRWYGQFIQPDGQPTSAKARRWTKQVRDITIAMVDISGTFSGGMGNEQAEDNYRMLGAIAAHQSGAVFFKLIGPNGTIDRWEQSFNLFLESLSANTKKL